MLSQSRISKSESETLRLAYDFAAQLAAGDNVLMIGELGAGKTTFVRGVVSFFDKEVEVSSPTFALIQIYPTTPPVCHVDLYRIGDESDLADLGLDEHFDSGEIVMVEWAEKCSTSFPGGYLRVTFGLRNEEERDILIEDFRDAAGPG